MTRAHIQARTLTDPGEMRQAVYAEGLPLSRRIGMEDVATGIGSMPGPLPAGSGACPSQPLILMVPFRR